MKTSLDLPDDLYRRVKARSAMEGRAVREVATELLAAWVNSAPATGEEQPAPPPADRSWLYHWSALGKQVERASKPKPAKRNAPVAKPAKRRSKADVPDQATGLVDQLRRDRR